MMHCLSITIFMYIKKKEKGISTFHTLSSDFINWEHNMALTKMHDDCC